MSPRVGPLEIGDPGKRHPGREHTDPPPETDEELKSQRAQVAEFRTGRHRISLPAVVLTGLITAFSGAVVAWINKPAPPPVAALTPEQSAALQQCARLSQDVGEIKTFVRWAEPQIGLLLVRTDQRAYTPPPRP